jgi:hypothetical protein
LTTLGDIKDIAILGAVAVGAYLLWDFAKNPAKTIIEQTSPLTTFGNPITAAPYEFGKTIGETIAAGFKGLFHEAPLSPGGLSTGDNL